MTATLSMWGDIAGPTAPVEFLREQADALTRRTGGRLRGVVVETEGSARFGFELCVLVPALNYEVQIVLLKQSEGSGYPVTLWSPYLDDASAPSDEAAFLWTLRAVLSASEVTKGLKELLASSDAKEAALHAVRAVSAAPTLEARVTELEAAVDRLYVAVSELLPRNA